MLKISRRSWHYRLYRYIRNVERGPEFLLPQTKGRTDYVTPQSLCPYAWSILLGLVGVVVVGWLVAIISLLIAAYNAVAWGGETLWEHGKVTFTPPALARRKREKQPKVKTRRPSLLRAFLKARKEKVCPLIELGD